MTTWTLSNGARVVVKPTDFENDTVLVQAESPGGTAQASDKVFPSARFAAEVVGGGGLGAYSDTDLDKVLAGRIASVQPWIGETMEGLDGTASVEDLETELQLVNLTMTAPRKDAQAFEVWKQSTREFVKNRRLMPERAFYEDMSDLFYQHNARRRPPELADVDKVDLDQAMAFYQDRFGDAGDFTFVIVGNVDLATLRPLVERYLASLPATGRKETEKDIGVKHPKGVTKKTIEGGTEPKSSVYLTYFGKQAWTRDDARDLGILADVLDIRLREVLREDMSGVYGVGVWGWISRVPRQERTFSVQFGCSPDNVDKLVKAVFTEIAAIEKAGIGDEYLEKIRTTRARERETALRDNQSWAGWLGDAARFGDTLDAELDLDGDLARVTSANVQAAAKRFADEKQYVLGVLVPQKAGATKPAAPAAPTKKKHPKAKRGAAEAVPKESPVKVEREP